MNAPAGLCGSCGRGMQWTVIKGELFVRCRVCMDLFGMDPAGGYHHEGREAVMPDGRPIRSIECIAECDTPLVLQGGGNG